MKSEIEIQKENICTTESNLTICSIIEQAIILTFVVTETSKLFCNSRQIPEIQHMSETDLAASDLRQRTCKW